MAAVLSKDLRRKLVAACESGTASQREVAEFFGVSLSVVEKLLRLYRETGDVVKPRHMPPGRAPMGMRLPESSCGTGLTPNRMPRWLSEATSCSTSLP
jgi:transposase-like protein